MSTSYDAVEDKFLKPEKGRNTMVRMVREVFYWRRDAATFTVAVMVTAVATVVSTLALRVAVNSVVSGNFSLLLEYASYFFLLYLVQFFSNRQVAMSATRVAQAVIKRMRDRAFSNIQRVPLDFFSKVKAGYLISRIENDSESISDFLTYQLPQVISGVTTIVIAAGVMFYLDARLAVYSLLVMPILGTFTLVLQTRVRSNYLRTRKTIAAITGNLAETIASIRTVKAFNAESQTEEKFDALNSDNFDANMKASMLSSTYSSVIRIIEAVGMVLVIYEGSISLLQGEVSLGTVVAFIVFVQQFFNPIVMLSQLYNMYQNSMVGASRIYSIIDSVPERDTGTEDVSSFSDSITGREMRVSYDDSIALERVSVEIRKGECVAIVGRTGAGKTTLTNVVLKFKYPDGGDISLDLHDLNNIETGSYRRLIVPVLQEPFLFNGSVYENIEYSRSGITREEVLSLIDRYGMSEIFGKLPRGIDSPVGEMGRNLSEGQRQAVSILRAFVRNPEIIIMDEATAQLDTTAERNIITAMRKFAKDGTLILISHRFSLITLADRILVLEKGGLVQEGTLDALSRQEGVFRELYKRSVTSYAGGK